MAGTTSSAREREVSVNIKMDGDACIAVIRVKGPQGGNRACLLSWIKWEGIKRVVMGKSGGNQNCCCHG